MMKINRMALLSSLEAVVPGLAKKDVVEQSSCFVFSDGVVATFNDEIACLKELPEGLNLTGAVVAEPFLKLLWKMPDETIALEAKAGALVVKGKGKRGTIRMEAEVLLPVDTVEDVGEEAWGELPSEMMEALNIVQMCAGTSKDDSFCLTCVNFTPDYIEACDNFQVSRYTIPTGVKEATLVRRDSIKHITGLGMVDMAETDTWLHFRNGTGLQLSCRRYKDEFPNVEPILDVQDAHTTTLPPGISEAVARAEIFSSENSEQNQVAIKLGANRFQITGKGANGEFTERKDVKYDGTECTFLIAPNLLVQLVDRHTEASISGNRLMVENGKFKYVTCLGELV
jgi:hypothetical protein